MTWTVLHTALLVRTGLNDCSINGEVAVARNQTKNITAYQCILSILLLERFNASPLYVFDEQFHGTVQYSTVQHSTVHTVQYSTVQYSTVKYSTVK